MEIIERIHNVETNEITDVLTKRPEVDIEEDKKYQNLINERKIELENKLAKQKIILEKLGLTEEEAKVLLG